MDKSAGPVSSIDFAIRSEILKIGDITKQLGVEPTRAFEKGVEYQGREKVGHEVRAVIRRHPWGVWHFDTAAFVTGGQPPEEHARFLLGQLEPASRAIQRLMADPMFTVLLTVWYVGPGGFEFVSSTVIRLAALCQRISITSWDADEIR